MSLANPSLAPFLLDNPPRCISVSYDKTVDSRTGKVTGVDVKSFKTFDTAIAKDDLVVIPTDTRWGFSVGRVEEIDTRVNFTSSETMRWIASKVDKDGYADICKQEDVLIGKVGQAQQAKAKRELADELRELDPDLVNLQLSGPVATPTMPAEAPARGGAQPTRRPREPGEDMTPF